MKAAEEAVGANPGAIALTEEARAWKGGRFRRKPKHFPRENHQGSCSCAFCAREVQNILSLSTTLRSEILGEEMECPVFDHGARKTILRTEIWSRDNRLD